MATLNPFALLGDEESDAFAVIDRAAAPDKPPAAAAAAPAKKQQQQAPAKLPSKPLPPAQAVKEPKSSQFERGSGRGGRGGGRSGYGNRDREREVGFNRPVRDGGLQGDRSSYNNRSNNYNRDGSDFQGGRGGYYGRGRGSFYGDFGNGPSSGDNGEGGQKFEGVRGRGRGRGWGRGYGDGAEGGRGRAPGRGYGEGLEGGSRGYGDGFDGEEQQRNQDYESGRGRGNGFKRDGSGGRSFGTQIKQDVSQTAEEEKPATEIVEKQVTEETKVEPGAAEEKKEEEEDNEMLLEDYYKLLNEKKKHLDSQRPDERKVIVDKDFERMQLVNKKHEEENLLKLGHEKDKGKKKEISEKEDKAKKSLSINEFLRPTEREEYYSSVRGRGRGDRGGYRGGFGGNYNTARQALAPRIEDPGQFPTLGGK